MRRIAILVGVGLLLGQGVGTAQETPARAAADLLIFRDGHYVPGAVLKTTADSVTFRPAQADAATRTIPEGQLAPSFFYTVRNRTVGDDAQARLQLATFAFQHGLYHQARVQLHKVESLDADLAAKFERAHEDEIREGMAETMLRYARVELRKKNLGGARHDLLSIRAQYPDTEAAAEASALLETVQARIERQRQHWIAAADDRKAEERRKLLEPALSDLHWGETILTRAGHAPGPTQQKNVYEEASHKFKLAIKRLDELIKGTDDPELKAQAERLLKEAQKGGGTCNVAAGEYYLSRRNYRDAIAYARAAKEIDPDNKDAAAVEMKAEIHPAGWGRRGRR